MLRVRRDSDGSGLELPWALLVCYVEDPGPMRRRWKLHFSYCISGPLFFLSNDLRKLVSSRVVLVV